jgi:hypothetical protein
VHSALCKSSAVLPARSHLQRRRSTPPRSSSCFHRRLSIESKALSALNSPYPIHSVNSLFLILFKYYFSFILVCLFYLFYIY